MCQPLLLQEEGGSPLVNRRVMGKETSTLWWPTWPTFRVGHIQPQSWPTFRVGHACEKQKLLFPEPVEDSDEEKEKTTSCEIEEKKGAELVDRKSWTTPAILEIIEKEVTTLSF